METLRLRGYAKKEKFRYLEDMIIPSLNTFSINELKTLNGL